MSRLGTTTILGDLTVTGDIKGNNINGGDGGDCLPLTGGALTGDLIIRKVSPVSLKLLPTDNVEGKGAEVVFGSTDNQHVRIRANHYDTVRAPFGLHIEKCAPNAQSGTAYLQVEGEIFANNTQKVYHEGNKPTPAAIGAARTFTTANGYDGITLNDGGTSNWIRTTVNGIIPYQSGGASSLGTASWPFQNIFANDIYSRGTLIESKFVHQLRRTSAENLNNPNYPQAYTASATDGVCATHLGLPQIWHHFQYFRHEDNNGFGVQVAYPLNNWNETIRFRSSSGTTWSNWKKILCTSKDQNVNGLWYEGTIAPTGTMRLNYSGYLYATRTYNAVWNDYAENFEKLDTEEIIEPGDVVVLAKDNTYKKSTKAYDEKVVGVYSDSYGHLLGGTGDEDIDKKQCVPVGLAGRVSVKVVGKVKEGQLLTSSHIPGVAMYASEYKPGTIIGKAVQDKDSDGIEKIKMFIMNI